MSDQHERNMLLAIQDFRRARRQAAMQEILGRVTGESTELLSFEEVRHKLKAYGGLSRGLQEVPIEAIIGSVGRYNDFTRSFLPRQEVDEQRWARVMAATQDLAGVPPIEVYQIGQGYFVLDGNHRVSVARQLGNKYIQAYVTEFRSKIPLERDDRTHDLTLKAEYTDFLERTHLDELRPGADLRLTEPGRYWELQTQIDALYYMMDLGQEWKIPYREAVFYWYDRFYLPMVTVIQERGILRDFPGRTETDLYLWIFRHRLELEKRLGLSVDDEVAATDFAHEHGLTANRRLARVGARLADVLTPDPLENGPAPGQWRRDRYEQRPDDRLFGSILVPLNGAMESWTALEQALFIARQEHCRVYGLHVIPEADAEQFKAAQALQVEFKQRCEAANVLGELSLETGHITRHIAERAGWVDLVVMHLAHPPEEGIFSKLGSGIRTLLRRCPRPVLTVPAAATPLARILLAYDGSPKAEEGLFIATYLAGRWQSTLFILIVTKKEGDHSLIKRVEHHLASRGVQAGYLTASGEVSEIILQTAHTYQCDLIIMGGYGHSAVIEVILGSNVDETLRQSNLPLLICR